MQRYISYYLSANKELFGIVNPDKELELLSSYKDELGQTHAKFQQKINNVKIFKGQLIVHFQEDGKIIGVNGKYYPTLKFNDIPNITENEAMNLAKNFLQNYSLSNVQTELLLIERNLSFYLCYAVKVPSKFYPNMKVYVNAENGEIIYKDDGIRFDGPITGSGIDLKGQMRAVPLYILGHAYLINTTLPMYIPPVDSLKGIITVYDAKNDTSGNGYQSAELIYDPNGDGIFNDNENQKAAISAYLFVQDAYNFFKTNFNRNSYDDAGHSMINVVHYKQSYNNAFWNGASMTYGDGDNEQFSNLAGAYDVIVHELTHAVTERTANLIYENQPGALNESMSDCFASVADSSSWLIGEEVYTPSIANDALRNMLNPHNNAASQTTGWQPEHMNEFVMLQNTEEEDHGGVHVNSGIPNRAFALTAESLSRKKAGKIWYRALTTYLTNNSSFSDARNACINSAKDLYGDNSNEMNVVKNAFETVGITGTGNIQTIDLVYDDGNPTTYVYEESGNYELAVKFSIPSPNVTLTKCQIYISGEVKQGGNGGFSLVLYSAGNDGYPYQYLINPYDYVPQAIGWQLFDITGLILNTDFFVSVKYNNFSSPAIGATLPPGNNRAYEFNGVNWSLLEYPSNYTLFMRATVQTTTGIHEISNEIPEKFEVFQNYPNPFNPSTSISYNLPKNEFVTLAIYNINGEKIAELVNAHQNPGSYTVTWNGKNNSGDNVSSGVYFYEINTGEMKIQKKMLLVK